MRMTIRTKLITVLGVMIALLGASSYLGLKETRAINDDLRAITERYATVQEQSLNLKASAAAAMAAIRSYLLAENSAASAELSLGVDEEYARAREIRARLAEVFAVNDPALAPAEALAEDFDAAWAAFQEDEQRIRVYGLQNSFREARVISSKRLTPVYGELLPIMDEVIGPVRELLLEMDVPAPDFVALEAALDSGMDNVRAMQAKHLDMLLKENDSVEMREAAAQRIADEIAAFEEKLASVQALAARNSDVAAQPIVPILETWETYRAAITDFTSMILLNSNVYADAIMEAELRPAAQALFAAAEAIAVEASRVMTAAARAGNATFASSQRLILILGVGATLIGIFAAVWLSTTISRGLGRAVRVVREVARGNLEVDAKSAQNDEMGTLLNAMDGMVGDLRGMSLAAERIAKGDLTVTVVPRSEDDRLGSRCATWW